MLQINSETNIPKIKKEETLLPLKIQKLFGWFAFFLGYPALYILGNSITLYIFIYIIIILNTHDESIFSLDSIPKRLFAILGVVALSSLILAPWADLRTYTLSSVQLYVQFVYWMSICFFLLKFYQRIDWERILYWFFIGTLLQIITFYILRRSIIDLGLITMIFANDRSRNSLLFQMIGSTPLILYYFKVYKNSTLINISVTLFLILAALLSGGRAGTILVFFISLLFWGRKLIFRPAFALATSLLLLFFVYNEALIEPYLISLSYKIEPYNERMAQMLRGEGENTDLSQDRSLLERQLHLDKGKEIIGKYPILGLGMGNYINYDSPLESLSEGKYFRLHGKNEQYYNQRSPHNSYIQIASEMGLMGLLIYLFLLVPPLFILYFKSNNHLWSVAVCLSIFGIMIHFYTIASAYGAISWFFIGLANAEAYRLIRK